MSVCPEIVNVATFGIEPAMQLALEQECIAVHAFDSPASAADAVHAGVCRIAIISKPMNWSLLRVSQLVTHGSNGVDAIVLSDLAGAYAPGLYVLDRKISPQTLATIVRRIVLVLTVTLPFVAARGR